LAKKITPFLMFEGSAEEAMRFYLGLFRDSRIGEIVRYARGEQGAEGSIKRADFTVAGQDVICIDSPVKHAFTFTPSISCSSSARARASSIRCLAGFRKAARC
jgi:predicted 3-demethylubiquinone-9 3-methyltransferase (glyoxalase superfamily)